MTGKTAGLPRIVVALGVVSLLTDIASEMVYPLLPTLLAGLGASAISLGAVEGVGDATAAILKLVTGRMSDRLERRKPLVLVGYALSHVARPLLVLATLPWHVVAVRFLDRVGKGVRSSPRDALLAASVPRARAGAAFGFHRAMDNVGATVGPLLVAAVLTLTHGDVHMVILATLVPGAAALAFIVFGVREPPKVAESPTSEAPSRERPPSALRNYLLILGFFSIINTSDLFLLRRLGDLGASSANVALAWALLNGVRALAGYPGGVLADRIGRARSMMLGWGVYALAYAALALSPSPWLFAAGLVVYGCFYGLTEGAERALVASLVPRSVLGASFGKFHLVTGIAMLPSNLAFGWAWDVFGGTRCLLASAAGALVALIGLGAWNARYAQRALRVPRGRCGAPRSAVFCAAMNPRFFVALMASASPLAFAACSISTGGTGDGLDAPADALGAGVGGTSSGASGHGASPGVGGQAGFPSGVGGKGGASGGNPTGGKGGASTGGASGSGTNAGGSATAGKGGSGPAGSSGSVGKGGNAAAGTGGAATGGKGGSGTGGSSVGVGGSSAGGMGAGGAGLAGSGAGGVAGSGIGGSGIGGSGIGGSAGSSVGAGGAGGDTAGGAGGSGGAGGAGGDVTGGMGGAGGDTAGGMGGAGGGGAGGTGGAGGGSGTGGAGGSVDTCDPDGAHPGIVVAGHCFFHTNGTFGGAVVDSQCNTSVYMGNKAHGAWIKTQAENDGLQAYLLAEGADAYWIALTYDFLSLSFKWTDGSSLSDTEWQPSAPHLVPAGDHVVLNKQADSTFLWDNRPANESHKILCELDVWP